ncbi:FkbM family methyltransferase [Arthrobacter castelli]|uniref:FkbM family methyltransferase n=1 Tax=Arthrobacter castelli TaxID=271431 RepID=UPI0004254029|nr:FkbM family methyltransferase [Arthrobacter castelli]
MAEPELLGLSAVLRPGDHVFDVGAAYGMYSFPLADMVGTTGTVHSFEPQGKQHRILTAIRRLSRAGHININRCLLGSRSGEHTLVLPVRFGVPVHGHAHVSAGSTESAPWFGSSRSHKAPMTTIDAWCQAHDIDTVSFIKVDVEGFEPKVLDGAAGTIAASHPSLLLEIEDRHTARYGTNGNQFADTIRRRWPEYDMYTWSDGAWRPALQVECGTRNYLFATKDAFDRDGSLPVPEPAAPIATAA